MTRKENIKKVFSLLMLVVYLFVSLFSHNFHNHNSGLEFKQFKFKNSESSIKKASHFDNDEDCVACHIFNEGKNVIPTIFTFNFHSETSFIVPNEVLQIICLYEKTEQFSLRGPPLA